MVSSATIFHTKKVNFEDLQRTTTLNQACEHLFTIFYVQLQTGSATEESSFGSNEQGIM